MRLVAVVFCAALVAAVSAPAAHAARCGELGRFGEGGASIVSVRATGAPCSEARTVLRRLIAGRRTAGWSCDAAGSEAVCLHRSNARVAYRAARNVRGCGGVAFEPGTENGAGGIRGKRVGCRTARRVARGSRPFGPTRPRDYRRLGFRCAGARLDTPLPLALYTCHRRDATVVFTRG